MQIYLPSHEKMPKVSQQLLISEIWKFLKRKCLFSIIQKQEDMSKNSLLKNR